MRELSLYLESRLVGELLRLTQQATTQNTLATAKQLDKNTQNTLATAKQLDKNTQNTLATVKQLDKTTQNTLATAKQLDKNTQNAFVDPHSNFLFSKKSN